MEVSELNEYLEDGEDIEVIEGNSVRFRVDGKCYARKNPTAILKRMTTNSNCIRIYVEHA